MLNRRVSYGNSMEKVQVVDKKRQSAQKCGNEQILHKNRSRLHTGTHNYGRKLSSIVSIIRKLRCINNNQIIRFIDGNELQTIIKCIHDQALRYGAPHWVLATMCAHICRHIDSAVAQTKYISWILLCLCATHGDLVWALWKKPS